MTYEELAAALRSAREARGLSQTDVANMIGVRQSAVGNWEAGNPPKLENLRRWSVAVGYRLDLTPQEPGRRHRLLASLMAAAAALEEDELALLARMAENLTTAPAHMRTLAANLLTTLADQVESVG